MAPLAVPDANQTSLTPSSADAWHVGMSPVFPSSLVLSDDAALQAVLSDIPFLSVGLLGFGVLTFFFAMRKFNRLSLYVFASVILAFIAGVLDVGQVLIRGRSATQSDTDVAAVLPLLVGRELALSISVGVRFLFFWTFVSRPPRGERRVRPKNDSQEQRHNLLRLESDIHSGKWMTRSLGYSGTFFKYSLLLAVLFVLIFQILWRVVADFSRVGPVYEADSGLEIAISALAVFKLFINARLSTLKPRWKTIRDYSPVMVALLVGSSVAVGNAVQFQFSETALGRFFQAVELYILVLYVHIASFYERRILLDPSVQKPARKTSIPAEGIDTRDRTFTIQVNSATTTLPPDVMNGITPRMGKVYSPPDNRLSPWLVADADQTPKIADAPRRRSTTDRIASWIIRRRVSARQEQEQSQLRFNVNMENGTPPVDTTKTGFARLPEAKELPIATTRKDSLYWLAAAPLTPAGQRPQPLTKVLDAPIPGMRNGLVSPHNTISSFAAVKNYSRDDFIPPKVPKLPGSPVYGLDGIVRYHDQSSSPPSQPTPSSRHISVQSAGIESLLHQQAELDKSVAELQFFSSVSAKSIEKQSDPGEQPSPLRSDFSLSNFPAPPPSLPSRSADKDVVDGSRSRASDVEQLRQANVAAVLPPPIAVGPTQISQSTLQSDRPLSMTTSMRTSCDSAVLGIASKTVVASGGTQYDASFIGGLTTPALKQSFSEGEQPRRSASLVMGRPEAEGASAAKAGPAEAILPFVTVQTSQAPPFANILGMGANPTPRPLVPRRMKQGLPSGMRLNISGPIRQPSDVRPTAYERPRPVPSPVLPS